MVLFNRHLVTRFIARQVQRIPINSINLFALAAARIFTRISKQAKEYYDVLRIKPTPKLPKFLRQHVLVGAALPLIALSPEFKCNKSRSGHAAIEGQSSQSVSAYSTVAADDLSIFFMLLAGDQYRSVRDSSKTRELSNSKLDCGLQDEANPPLAKAGLERKCKIRFPDSFSRAIPWTFNRHQQEDTSGVFGYPQTKREDQTSIHPKTQDLLIHLLNNDQDNVFSKLDSNNPNCELNSEIRQVLHNHLIDWTKINNVLIHELITVISSHHHRAAASDKEFSSVHETNIDAKPAVKQQSDKTLPHDVEDATTAITIEVITPTEIRDSLVMNPKTLPHDVEDATTAITIEVITPTEIRDSLVMNPHQIQERQLNLLNLEA